MPELPEVETVRRGLDPAMTGKVLESVEQRRPDLRWPMPENFVARLEGARIERLRRRSYSRHTDLKARRAVQGRGASGLTRSRSSRPARARRLSGRRARASR